MYVSLDVSVRPSHSLQRKGWGCNLGAFESSLFLSLRPSDQVEHGAPRGKLESTQMDESGTPIAGGYM